MTWHDVPPQPSVDEELVQRLPLPLAQLVRRAYNSKSLLESHHSAYYLWEASLKLLSTVAIIEYVGLDDQDPQLNDRLKALARPSLGHWWEFIRRLLPVLADSGDESFTKLRDTILGRRRLDMPRVAGLDAVLFETLEGGAGESHTLGRLSELIDRLIRYRNSELGHGATGQRPTEFYARMAPALLAAATEFLCCIDPLAGRRMVYVDDVRLLSSGEWLVERFELRGEAPKRLESLSLTSERKSCLLPGRVYLMPSTDARPDEYQSVHPLLLFDSESGRSFFLNARRKKASAEYLCYTTGDVVQRDTLASEHRELLAEVLRVPVTNESVIQWGEQSRTGEPKDNELETTPQRVIGEYELLSRIGRGGMGAVYRAWQPSLAKQVALKTMLRSGDPKAEARFAREIRALGRVEHSNLVKVFASGSHGEHWFYTMELIEGTDLSAICEQLGGSDARSLTSTDWQKAVSCACQQTRRNEQTLSNDDSTVPRAEGLAIEEAGLPDLGHGYVERVVELIYQTALAVQALNDAGVIHRDIKPGNIMLTREGNRAILMDLGLAQIADEAEGRLTRTRQFVGTLRYASPEQVLSVPLDARSDVYGLGATLWELLTLQPLFGATDQMPTPELMLKVQSTDPERPRRFNPSVSADLESIVLKCLEKDRSRRYGSASELTEDLKRWQTGCVVQAQPATFRYVFGRFVYRYRRRILAATTITIATFMMVGGIAVYAEIQRRDAVEQSQYARFQQKQAKRLQLLAEERGDAAREFANETLSTYGTTIFHFARDLSPEDVQGTQREVLQKILTRLRSMRNRLEGDPTGTTLLLRQIDRYIIVVLNDLGDVIREEHGHSSVEHQDRFATSYRMYEEAIQIGRRLIEEEPDDSLILQHLSVTYNNIAQMRLATEEWDDAFGHFHEAMQFNEQRTEQWPDDALAIFELGRAQADLGETELRRDNPTEATIWYRKSVKTLEGIIRRNLGGRSILAQLSREYRKISNSRRVWFLAGFGSESVVAWLRQGRSTRRRRVSSICSGRVPPSEPWNDGFQGNSSRLASVTRPGAHTVSAVLEKSGRRRAGRSVSAGTEPGDVTRRSTSPCRKYEAAGERPQAASPSVNLRSRHAPGQVEQHHLVQMTHAGESKVVEV